MAEPGTRQRPADRPQGRPAHRSAHSNGRLSIDWLPGPDDWRLYRLILTARIRSDWQYRVSFFTFLVGQAMATALEFVAILLLLDVTPSIGGWDGDEVLFLFGLATLPFGLADMFVSSLDRVATYVQAGTFDRVLLRPVPAMLQVSALEFELRRIGKVVPSLTVLVWAVPRVGIDWDLGTVAVLVMALACGTVIYSSLWIITSASAFWVVAAQEATNAATYGGQFANQYPLHLYREWIRVVLGWIIPLAFVAYVPAIYLLDAANPLDLPPRLVFLSAPVAAASLVVAVKVWGIGIRRYQGTGS